MIIIELRNKSVIRDKSFIWHLLVISFSLVQRNDRLLNEICKKKKKSIAIARLIKFAIFPQPYLRNFRATKKKRPLDDSRGFLHLA